MDRRGSFDYAVATVVAERRKSMGLDQKDVWEAADYSRPSYQRLEQAARAWRADDIRRVAKVLQTQAWEIMKAAEERFDDTADPEETRAAAELRAALGID